MKFVLSVRKVEESDLSRATPFLPDDEDYEMYLQAFFEDISGIAEFSRVAQNGSTFHIETAGSVQVEKMLELIKPAFNPSAMQKLRFVSLVEAPQQD